MDDLVISARNLGKTFRLYPTKQSRLLDILGLLPRRWSNFSEHRALDSVNLDIRRGERIGVIGRNGAGKSTLLKLITGVSRPTEGELVVTGETQALLQLGTGFHPELTGRENIQAYLALLGLEGNQDRQLVRDIIDFAEIEEYIDQPLKVYSSGMAMRLMFAASTAIAPELLVIDEVLSVGDAYFAQKSFQRIRDICESRHSTLLLVSHDIYMAAKICSRMIWMERGQVAFDGSPSEAIAAYEFSVREQEEARIRHKTRMMLGELASRRELTIEIVHTDMARAAHNLHVGTIQLTMGGKVQTLTPVIGAASGNIPRFEAANGLWGEAVTWQGRPAMPLTNHGSPFHKADCVFALADHPDQGPVRIDMELALEAGPDFEVWLVLDDRKQALGRIGATGGQWSTLTFEASLDAKAKWVPLRVGLAKTAMFGSGLVSVTDITVLGADNQPRFSFHRGEALRVAIDYRVNDPTLEGEVDVMIGILRADMIHVCRSLGRMRLTPGSSGRLIAEFPVLRLGDGQYAVSIMIAESGYFDSTDHPFYAINPAVYCCLNRVLEFQVQSEGCLGSGVAFIDDCIWSDLPAQENTP